VVMYILYNAWGKEKLECLLSRKEVWQGYLVTAFGAEGRCGFEPMRTASLTMQRLERGEKAPTCCVGRPF